MKRLLTLTFALIAVVGSGSAQQWLMPEACWVYRNSHLGDNIFRLWYEVDSIVDGHEVQVVRRTRQDFYQGVALGPPTNWPDWFFRIEGNAVMRRCAGLGCWTAAWDTVYFLGNPGDRWSSEVADPTCYPHGVLEITDTGHVVIQGITRRTWDLVYLDENGQAMPDLPSQMGDSLGVVEGIGSPLGNPPQPCDGGVIDYFFISLLHYSDAEISFPAGTTCDITTAIDHHRPPEPTVSVAPNPGTDQLWITGLATTVFIEVRDPLGRVVHSRSNLPTNAPIETAAWESGTYFITVVQADGARDLLRWVKQ